MLKKHYSVLDTTYRILAVRVKRFVSESIFMLGVEAYSKSVVGSVNMIL